ncbi:zinc transporter ZntB [Xenorhabdus sp. 42]|uniref:Zinc transport protein ZntB n=1 Tax=Xenorhabdus szentirmaii TaxID=290112 RepID=A0AAW3YYZ5_9GAMM|nr:MULTISPECIES: zinc transporter ZntB [Xenorhabdus]MBD2779155.1 zinc transporter ZntB [Xenorhabdus sp. 38]MBD2792606.1 zinc transporter ZntB [Xenorhabdus sp. CUL]MBD2802632.1 zinc transporter ZntB [Xenorhabdus sp. M]MBD2805817.1 zinc transporter ZntB [Xenorhabdus sp. ZM]MBD2821367.1 zinc transporter ZntB [Xenorhabdus sp. 42]
METIYGSVFKGSDAVYSCQLNGKGGTVAFGEDSLATAEQPFWQHFDYKNQASYQWLMNTTLLPPSVKEGLLSESIRPKVLRTGEGTLITLRSVNRNNNARPDHLVSFRIYINDKVIISSRHRKIHSIDQVLDDLHNGVGAKNTGHWLIEIADAMTDEVNDFIEELHDNLIELEDGILEQKIPGRGELVLLRKQLIVLRRYMAPQRDVFTRLANERLPWMSDDERHLMQEVADRLGRGLDDLDGCIARTAVLADEITSMMADAMNRRTYMMSLLAMIFLPSTFLTGLFGVNLGGIPGSAYQFGFLLFSLLLSVLIAIFWWWLRRTKWL